MKSAQENTQEDDLEEINTANQGSKKHFTFVETFSNELYVHLLGCPG